VRETPTFSQTGERRRILDWVFWPSLSAPNSLGVVVLIAPTVSWQPSNQIGGRYTLVGRLAYGGMAEVWLARQLGPQGFNRLVVIKRVLESRMHEPEFQTMFADEGRLSASLNHPNIVQTLDFGEEQGVTFIVLEYLFGETFHYAVRASRKSGTPFPIDAAVKIVSLAAQGLASAHNRVGLDGQALGIVHRDVSPQNIFITYDGLVKVIDFGIARSTSREFHTEASQVRGRVHFMSPEQIAGQVVDQRADVFALGAVLFEAVTGTALHDKADTIEMVKRLVSAEPLPSAIGRNPDLPEDLGRILTRALEKNPDLRYPTSTSFYGELEDYLRHAPTRETAPSIAELMTTLFPIRRLERTHVLKKLVSETSAMRWTPSVLDAVNGVARGTPTHSSPGMPTVSISPDEFEIDEDSSVISENARSKRLAMAIAVVGLGMALGLTLVFLFRGKTPAPQPVVEPPALVAVAMAEPYLRSPIAAPEKAKEPDPPAPPVPTPTPQPRRKGEEREARATGRLTFDTVPWTQVFMKGKKLGDTPLVDLKVPSGSLELLLVNEQENIRTVVEVDVVAGQTTFKKLQF
jgi:eukaryotic-like serine/threonine-protein kinase